MGKVEKATSKKELHSEINGKPTSQKIPFANRKKPGKVEQLDLSKDKVLVENETKVKKTKKAKEIKKSENGDFDLVQMDESIHDVKFETKPVSFLKDSLNRFAQNKASIIAACIIFIIVLFAIIVPFASPFTYVDAIAYPDGFLDPQLSYCLPKAFDTGTGFWDGTEVKGMYEAEYIFKKYSDANHPYIYKDDENPVTQKIVDPASGKESEVLYYTVTLDSYAKVGVVSRIIQKAEYEAILERDADLPLNERILKPVFDYEASIEEYIQDVLIGVYNTQFSYYNQIKSRMITMYETQGIYYKLGVSIGSNGRPTNAIIPLLDANGDIDPLYDVDDPNLSYGTGSVPDATNNYTQYSVRMDYMEYFKYKNGFEPRYIFGSNGSGQDIFTRLALGARLSLILGICVTFINFIIGLIWGAISGYYGGRIDLIMERITDILSAIPSLIIMTLTSIYFANTSMASTGQLIALVIGFVATGWIGTSSTARMQFYRFKGQEYVLASRTLGARDGRLIFKHILPNAAGTLVTSTVLMVPGVIFSEASLSYLGIINLSSSNTTSIGTLLNEGQAVIMQYPYMILFPAVVISLLMISFNLFGNGLRDAFNTQLRGSGD